ncbi:unnamed protein product [Trichobilharzia szidati]|nr:unnamed protein product [Trichobilharzia szidati]
MLNIECHNQSARNNKCVLFQQWLSCLNLSRWPLLSACFNELLGTAVFMIIGLGVIIQCIIGSFNNHEISRYISISVGWGIAATIGMLIASSCNDNEKCTVGLLNPALTFAYCLIGKLPFRFLLPISLCQIIGSTLGGLVIIGIYWENIQVYAKHMSSGRLEMNTTGVLLVTIPGASHQACLLDHILSTGLFSGIMLAIQDRNNYNIPHELQLIYIGILMTGIIGSLCLNIGTALNPARDLGARIAIALCGWGIEAFQANNYYFWIPIVGPYLGAVIGTFLYELTIGLCFAYTEENHPSQSETLNEDVTTTIDTITEKDGDDGISQNSLAEEMNEDLFDIVDIESCCFANSEVTLYSMSG